MTISLGFFNNKGGVGKTTLASNMAAILATKLEYSVLVVDCDPQCNATQLLLSEEEWEAIYGNTRTSASKTVLQPLRHIRAGDSGIDPKIPITVSERFRCDVLPGHPSLASLEDRFSAAWVSFLSGDLGGARRSVWAASLVDSSDYDLIIFDVGPSLGALNRSVLLGCDRFVTPMAADLFSLYALDNISNWMNTWLQGYDRAYEYLSEDREIKPDDWSIPQAPRPRSAFAGYTIQQYVTRTSGGKRREVKAYDRYRRQIPERAAALSDIQATTARTLDLGTVPNMFSMIPLAQAVHAPITDLTLSDGLKGGQVNQQARYAEQLFEIADRLMANIGLEL